MGAGNSVQSYITSTNNIVVNSITTAYQSQNLQSINSQNITVDCSTAKDDYLKVITDCIDTYSKPGYCGGKNCDWLAICGGISDMSCIGSNIVFDQQIVINVDMTQDSKQWSDIQNTVAQNIQANIQQSSGLFEFDDKVKNDINSLVSTVTNTILNDVQQSYVNLPNQQSVLIGSGSVNLVTLKSAESYIETILQQNEQYTQVLNQVAVDIQANVSQESSIQGTLRLVLIVIFSIIGALILLGVVLVIIKMIRK